MFWFLLYLGTPDVCCDVPAVTPATEAASTCWPVVPAAPGTQVQLKVTSANGRIPAAGSTLRSATLSLQVDGPCPGKCASNVREEKSHFKKVVAASSQANLRTGQPAGGTRATGELVACCQWLPPALHAATPNGLLCDLRLVKGGGQPGAMQPIKAHAFAR